MQDYKLNTFTYTYSRVAAILIIMDSNELYVQKSSAKWIFGVQFFMTDYDCPKWSTPNTYKVQWNLFL